MNEDYNSYTLSELPTATIRCNIFHRLGPKLTDGCFRLSSIVFFNIFTKKSVTSLESTVQPTASSNGRANGKKTENTGKKKWFMAG